MLAAVVTILAKRVVILELGLWNITSLIFLKIYTPPQHTLTQIILCFKIIDEDNSKFDFKIKNTLHIN